MNSNGSFSHTVAKGLVPSRNTHVEVRTYSGCDGSYKLDTFVRNASNSKVINDHGSAPVARGQVWVSYNDEGLLVVQGQNLKGAFQLKFRIVEKGLFYEDYGWYRSRSGRETWDIENGKFNF